MAKHGWTFTVICCQDPSSSIIVTEVIPTKWLFQEDGITFCWWPPEFLDIITAAELQVDHDIKNWRKYVVREILFECESYKDGRLAVSKILDPNYSDLNAKSRASMKRKWQNKISNFKKRAIQNVSDGNNERYEHDKDCALECCKSKKRRGKSKQSFTLDVEEEKLIQSVRGNLEISMAHKSNNAPNISLEMEDNITNPLEPIIIYSSTPFIPQEWLQSKKVHQDMNEHFSNSSKLNSQKTIDIHRDNYDTESDSRTSDESSFPNFSFLDTLSRSLRLKITQDEQNENTDTPITQNSDSQVNINPDATSPVKSNQPTITGIKNSSVAWQNKNMTIKNIIQKSPSLKLAKFRIPLRSSKEEVMKSSPSSNVNENSLKKMPMPFIIKKLKEISQDSQSKYIRFQIDNRPGSEPIKPIISPQKISSASPKKRFKYIMIQKQKCVDPEKPIHPTPKHVLTGSPKPQNKDYTKPLKQNQCFPQVSTTPQKKQNGDLNDTKNSLDTLKLSSHTDPMEDQQGNKIVFKIESKKTNEHRSTPRISTELLRRILEYQNRIRSPKTVQSSNNNSQNIPGYPEIDLSINNTTHKTAVGKCKETPHKTKGKLLKTINKGENQQHLAVSRDLKNVSELKEAENSKRKIIHKSEPVKSTEKSQESSPGSGKKTVDNKIQYYSTFKNLDMDESQESPMKKSKKKKRNSTLQLQNSTTKQEPQILSEPILTKCPDKNENLKSILREQFITKEPQAPESDMIKRNAKTTKYQTPSKSHDISTDLSVDDRENSLKIKKSISFHDPLVVENQAEVPNNPHQIQNRVPGLSDFMESLKAEFIVKSSTPRSILSTRRHSIDQPPTMYPDKNSPKKRWVHEWTDFSPVIRQKSIQTQTDIYGLEDPVIESKAKKIVARRRSTNPSKTETEKYNHKSASISPKSPIKKSKQTIQISTTPKKRKVLALEDVTTVLQQNEGTEYDNKKSPRPKRHKTENTPTESLSKSNDKQKQSSSKKSNKVTTVQLKDTSPNVISKVLVQSVIENSAKPEKNSSKKSRDISLDWQQRKIIKPTDSTIKPKTQNSQHITEVKNPKPKRSEKPSMTKKKIIQDSENLSPELQKSKIVFKIKGQNYFVEPRKPKIKQTAASVETRIISRPKKGIYHITGDQPKKETRIVSRPKKGIYHTTEEQPKVKGHSIKLLEKVKKQPRSPKSVLQEKINAYIIDFNIRKYDMHRRKVSVVLTDIFADAQQSSAFIQSRSPQKVSGLKTDVLLKKRSLRKHKYRCNIKKKKPPKKHVSQYLTLEERIKLKPRLCRNVSTV